MRTREDLPDLSALSRAVDRLVSSREDALSAVRQLGRARWQVRMACYGDAREARYRSARGRDDDVTRPVGPVRVERMRLIYDALRRLSDLGARACEYYDSPAAVEAAAVGDQLERHLAGACADSLRDRCPDWSDVCRWTECAACGRAGASLASAGRRCSCGGGIVLRELAEPDKCTGVDEVETSLAECWDEPLEVFRSYGAVNDHHRCEAAHRLIRGQEPPYDSESDWEQAFWRDAEERWAEEQAAAEQEGSA